MPRHSSKLDRLSLANNISTHSLEAYIDKTGERFPDELLFNNVNLLDILTTDYADYSRKILRIIFTSDELKNCILPPGKSYLARPPLDQNRFKLFTDAIRYKFKLDSTNFGMFYRLLLRRKLTNFLIEERRREVTKQARHAHKQAQQAPQENKDNGTALDASTTSV